MCIRSLAEHEACVQAWGAPSPRTPIGLILAMESADPILGPDQVPEWHALGLRMVSISHYGTSAYCHRTGTEGGLLPRGRDLGAACDAWMLDPVWRRELPCFQQTTRATLETVAERIDHVCQIAGSARHAGIGSDLDGGYGYEQSPRNLNTIADLQRLRAIFARRGYPPGDIRSVLSGNWIRLLKDTWTN